MHASCRGKRVLKCFNLMLRIRRKETNNASPVVLHAYLQPLLTLTPRLIQIGRLAYVHIPPSSVPFSKSGRKRDIVGTFSVTSCRIRTFPKLFFFWNFFSGVLEMYLRDARAGLVSPSAFKLAKPAAAGSILSYLFSPPTCWNVIPSESLSQNGHECSNA